VRILLATDVFPPRSGGSGWSTYHLARALRERGHAVSIVRAALSPRQASPYVYDGFVVDQIAVPVPPVPLLRNVAKNDVFWTVGGRALARHARRHRADLIHGQHVMTIPAAVRAGRAVGRPVVATVRDYWATCPITTRLRPEGICHQCTRERLSECLTNHHPLLASLVSPLAGYVVSNRHARQAALRAANLVVAVSHYVAADLKRHAAIDAVVVPNMIDIPAEPPAAPSEVAHLSAPPVVFVGKLDRHKGADRLPAIIAGAGRPATLVIIGDGPLRESIIAECEARRVPLLLIRALPNAAVLGWLGHARAVVTPARWPEPLSRVWLEAASVGCPIVTTPVGGALDAVVDGETGLLAGDDPALSAALGVLLADDGLRQRLGAGAAALARARFATEVVVDRMEALYRSVIDSHGQ
jgi:glycosyltransferase involved in cell wall biosynthesis